MRECGFLTAAVLVVMLRCAMRGLLLLRAAGAADRGEALEPAILAGLLSGEHAALAGDWEGFQGSLLRRLLGAAAAAAGGAGASGGAAGGGPLAVKAPDFARGCSRVGHAGWDLGGRLRSNRVLLATAVSNSHRAVENLEHNLLRLWKFADGDSFAVALFHHDGGTELWERWEHYRRPYIVLRLPGPGCKVQFWAQITTDISKDYDYIWLADEDLRFDFFRWDLYRLVLAGLQPLVSQPSVLKRDPQGRDSDITFVRLQSWDRLGFPVVKEIPRDEQMTPVLSTRIWASIAKRMQGNDRRSDWYLDAFWSSVAHLSKTECGTVGPLLINSAPVRHMDWRNVYSTNHSPRCITHSEQNRRNVSLEEAEQVAADLRPGCRLGGDVRSWAQSLNDRFFAHSHRFPAVICDEYPFPWVVWPRRGCRAWLDPLSLPPPGAPLPPEGYCPD